VAVIVVAPNAFKGTATAADAAAAIAAGWRSVRAADELVLVPLADGGDGTLDAVATAVPAAVRQLVEVSGPVGGRQRTEWLRLPDGTGLVELAVTGGLAIAERAPMPPEDRAARASTLGFGEAVAAALDAGCHRMLLAVGGSASTDGGAGLLQALGARLLDRRGSSIPPGNAGLAELVRVDLTGLRPVPPGGVGVLTDVRNPLLGPDGAAAVFGPQKGMAPGDLPAFEARLGSFARAVTAVVPVDAATPGAGAAGGAAFAALAWGAELVDGAAEVARLSGLLPAVDRAASVVTGEGRYDQQTAAGKTPALVQSLAGERGVPVLLVAGSVTASVDGWADTVALADLAGDPERAMREPLTFLRAAGERLAARFRVTAQGG
jgi:glycerate 2-kinase